MGLESADQEQIQRIHRIIRHDLRNPLAVIMGRCELLESDLLGPLEPKQRDSVATISRHAERLAGELDVLAALLDEVSGNG